jgi:hypothetical protein
VKKIITMLAIVFALVSCSNNSPRIENVTGKGMFIFELYNIGILSDTEKTIDFTIAYDQNGNPLPGKSAPLDTILARLQKAKINWVAIKLGDSDAYWLRGKSSILNWLKAQNLTFEQMLAKFRDAGIKVHGFHYIRGSNNWNLSTEVECAKNIIESGVDGYIMDAEFELETLLNSEKYMEDFFAQVSTSPSFANIPIGYTTYSQLSKHFKIPYKVFEKFSDFLITQNYWVDRDPECKFFSPEYEIDTFKEDLRVNRDGKKLKLTKSGSNDSIILAGSLESQACMGTRATSTDIVRFRDLAKNDFPTGLCWWCLDLANDSDLETLGNW